MAIDCSSEGVRTATLDALPGAYSLEPDVERARTLALAVGGFSHHTAHQQVGGGQLIELLHVSARFA